MRFIERQNPGPAIIFLHGFPNNSRLWEHQLSRFDSRYHTICAEWNMPSTSHLDSGVSALIARIRALKAEFPSKSVFLVAHDIGCFFASEVSKAVPELVDAQIFINGLTLEQYSLRWRSFQQWLRSSYVSLLMIPGFSRLVSGRLAGSIGKFFYRLGGAGEHSPLNRKIYSDFSAIGIYRELTKRVLSGYFRRKQFVKTKTPTMLVYGESDPFLIAPSLAEADRCYTSSDRISVSGGHWLPFTHAFTINQILTSAFARIGVKL